MGRLNNFILSNSFKNNPCQELFQNGHASAIKKQQSKTTRKNKLNNQRALSLFRVAHSCLRREYNTLCCSQKRCLFHLVCSKSHRRFATASSLVIDDMVAPHKELSDPTCLASLQSLLLQQQLLREGVLDRARVAERNDNQERAIALLRYLENNKTMDQLVQECREQDTEEESDNNNNDIEGSFAPSFDVNTEEGRFLTKLRDVAWLLVETEGI